MLLKSTCDLIREPIHNPDTLQSCLTLFCKQMWSMIFMRFCCGSLVVRCQVAIFQLTWSSSVTEFHSTVMFVLRSFGWPQHIFLSECSVCFEFFRLLRLTTGVCLVMLFSLNEDKNEEMTMWWAFEKEVYRKKLPAFLQIPCLFPLPLLANPTR